MSLHLTHLKVEQLRRFRQPFELTQLQPGLNIFTGPNEAGKSTLVRAIRAAFFERYRSKSVDDLRPWGDSGATPAVEIGFVLDGQAALLSKSFLGSKARCDLRIGGQSWSGTDAEDHLAQLLGFAFAGKGASKAEHWGIPGLLWVEQGGGQEFKDAADHAHEHLHQALQSHLRASHAASLTATGGDAVLDAVIAQRDQLLTNMGRHKGPLAESVARVEALFVRCDELQAKVHTYQQQVDELARLRAGHLRDETDRPWDALQHQLDAAQKALLESQQAHGQWAEARKQHEQLQAQQGLLLQQLDHHQQRERDAAVRQQQAEQARIRLQEAQDQLAASQQHAALAQSALTLAQAQLRLAQQTGQRQQLVKELASQAQAVADAQATLALATQAEAEVQALRQQIQGAPLSLADMQSLRQLERQAHESRLRMQDQATRVQFRLLPGQVITMQEQGDALRGEGERLLMGATTLQLPGLGELLIQPGGEDLGELAQQQHAAAQALRDALLLVGEPDLPAAEQRFEQQAQQAQLIKLAEQALALHAPKGVEALASEVDRLQVQWQQTEVALGRMPEPAAASEGRLSLPAAESELTSAEQAQAQAGLSLGEAQTNRAKASATAEAADREWMAIQQQLAMPDVSRRHTEAKEQLLTVRAQIEAQLQRVAQFEVQVEQARPDILQQDVMRLERSLAQTRQAHQERRTQIAVVEQALAQQGAQGLEEQLALSRGELSRAELRQKELQLRADALELLRTRLESKRQAALQRLQAPLQKHLQRYLGLLFPGATVAVSDTLVPTELTRRTSAGGQEVSAFDTLSFGAREQLGLVSRFAYADLLREAGRPTLIILDDALVHSDAERLAMMKRLVFDASQRHQVLLFSCHPESWGGMGDSPRQVKIPVL